MGQEQQRAAMQCSFCNKGEAEIEHLIVASCSPDNTLAICDECVDLCADIVAEAKKETAIKRGGNAAVAQ